MGHNRSGDRRKETMRRRRRQQARLDRKTALAEKKKNTGVAGTVVAKAKEVAHTVGEAVQAAATKVKNAIT